MWLDETLQHLLTTTHRQDGEFWWHMQHNNEGSSHRGFDLKKGNPNNTWSRVLFLEKKDGLASCEQMSKLKTRLCSFGQRHLDLFIFNLILQWLWVQVETWTSILGTANHMKTVRLVCQSTKLPINHLPIQSQLLLYWIHHFNYPCLYF